MLNRRIAALDAPSNLGLRPPAPGCVPGCYKLPWALRDRGLLAALGAEDAGALVPPRYVPDWQPGDGDRNAEAIAAFSLALAERVGALAAAGDFALVLGGDCSILLGNALALKRLGRYGLVYLDAHDDFRHLGNAPAIGAAAGEDLALVTGRGDPRLTALGGGALIDPADIAVLGVRPESTELDELRELGMLVSTSKDLAAGGIEAGAAAALARVTANTAGFWIHLDWDVIDGAALPAVDCPEPGGLSFDELAALLGPLLASPRCAGLELTIYDPDLDPSGAGAAAIVACLARAFGR